MKQRAWILLFVAAAFLLLPLWRITLHLFEPNPEFRNLVAEYQRQTIPEDAKVVGTGEINREAYLIQTHWDIECAWSWPEYREWAKKQLRAKNVTLKEEADRNFSYSRVDHADILTLRVKSLDDGPPLRLRIIFEGRPW